MKEAFKSKHQSPKVSGLDLYFDFSRKFLPDRRNRYTKAMVEHALGEGLRRSWRGRQVPNCKSWREPCEKVLGSSQRKSRRE